MEERIPWSIDGEYEPGANEVRIQNIPNAIHIIT